MLPSPYGSGLGLWSFRLSRSPLRSLSLRPDDSLTIPWMAWSVGFRNSVSFLPATQATRRLTLASVGLCPTERASLRWTHFRTAGFPQYGYKASLSDGAFQTVPRAEVDSRHTLAASPVCPHPSRTRRPRHLVGSESHRPGRCARRCASDIRRSTPGVLGSGASCAVSRHPRLLRPHPSVSQARDDFAAVPFIRRAFAVRERLGDPRDLPYFRCCPVHTCHRPYAGGFEMLSRYCTHRDTRLPRFRSESPPTRARLCQQYPTGVLFRRCIVRFMLRPACLPRPPDWLDTDGITCVPSMLLRTLSPPLLAPVVTVRRWESG